MKSPILASLASVVLAAATGCQFNSKFSVDVQVFNGPTIPRDTAPDPDTVIRSAGETVDSALAVVRELNQAADATESMVISLSRYITAYSNHVATVSTKADYRKAANQYLDAHRQAVRVLGEQANQEQALEHLKKAAAILKANASDTTAASELAAADELLKSASSELLQANPDLQAANNDLKNAYSSLKAATPDLPKADQNVTNAAAKLKSAVPKTAADARSLLSTAGDLRVEGISLESYVQKPLRAWLRSQNEALGLQLDAIRGILLMDDEARRLAAVERLLGDSATVQRMADLTAELQRFKFAKEDLEYPLVYNPFDRATKGAGRMIEDFRNKVSKGTVSQSLAKMLATKNELVISALKLKQSEYGSVSHQDTEVIAVITNTIALKRSLSYFADNVDLLKQHTMLLDGQYPSNFVRAVLKFREIDIGDTDLDQQLANHSAIDHMIRGHLDVGEWIEQFSTAKERFHEAQEALSHTALAPVREGKNLMAAIRKDPFEATDPNIKVITDKDNLQFWNLAPVNGLDGVGDGDAQYIIVQDSPTTFRVKELSVDPTSVVQLNTDVGAIAVEVLKGLGTAAAGVAGVSIPKKGGGSSGEVTTGPDISELEELVSASASKTIAALLARLRALKSGLPDDANPNNSAQQQLVGSLNNYETQLDAIVQEIAAIRQKYLNETPPGDDPPNGSNGGDTQ